VKGGDSGLSEVLKETARFARDWSAIGSSVIWVILLELVVELRRHIDRE